MLTEKIKDQIKKRGVVEKDIQKQTERFKKGFPYLNIVAPATLNDGIMGLTESKASEFAKVYENELQNLQITKFIPASGAASRMFKMLFEFLNSDGTIDDSIKNPDFYSIEYFFMHLEKFAFYCDLQQAVKTSGKTIEEKRAKKEYKYIVKTLLDEKGLDYGKLPKGLLSFHTYPEINRTAIEEHFVEGAKYATDKDRIVDLHFTLSPEHIDKFENHILDIKHRYEKIFNVTYRVTHSIQDPRTDTIAVDTLNKPIVDNDGLLIFRPGGHGALIHNLNKIHTNCIFIKNIDNVCSEEQSSETILYKKALGGILIDAQKKAFALIEALNTSPTEENIKAGEKYFAEILYLKFNSNYNHLSSKEKCEYLLSKLNRPFRVCGMVKNQGEPGGGPFLVQDSQGEISLQIVEKAQINEADKKQIDILNKSTHFNPVDIVCGIYNYKGEKIDLLNHIDEDAGIITEKSKDGISLKALELPGLWNGAMSKWNTIFAEVPISTFTPVKEVNDLLRKEHQ